jgi:pyrroloquinoline quinone biosynthesis protein B
LKIIVTGSAAGGGFPQWNCRCRMCSLFWQRDRRVRRRTQSSLAVSGDGANWVILNCSPDIREQIGATPKLRPKGSPRDSPIRAVVLTNGDIDHIGGLLSLREQTPFALFASRAVLDVLGQNPVFGVLDPAVVSKQPLPAGRKTSLPGGLNLQAFSVPGKLPLYKEVGSAPTEMRTEFTFGLWLSDEKGNSMSYIPSCARVDGKLLADIGSVHALFFDGTLWTDEELIDAGVGRKTGRDMGHIPISGPNGSIAALANVQCGEKFFIHINNTNPLNCETSPERKFAEEAGWRIPADGDEISL